MILQELCRLYERMKNDPCCDIPSFGWSVEKVDWELTIDVDGSVVGISPLVTNGENRKQHSRSITVPEHSGRSSGIKAFFCCDNAKYLFGLDEKRGDRCLAASRELHHAVLDGCEDAAAHALLAFFDEENRVDGLREDARLGIEAGGLIVFRLAGESGWLHERSEIAGAWDRWRAEHSDSDVEGFDAVTGEYAKLARLFPQVTGVPGAQSAGTSLVSFNFPASESYGRAQAYNASLSEYSAFAAGTALRYLLGNRERRTILGNTIVVFWSDSPTPTPEEDSFIFSMMQGAPHAEDSALLHRIDAAFEAMRAGRWGDFDFDTNVDYCILGISPNAARLSVRFFERNTLGAYARNYGEYLNDIELDGVKIPSLWALLRQTAPQGKAENIPSTLVDAYFSAMLNGTDFPVALHRLILARMQADKGRNNVWDLGQRAALLKACLVRHRRLRGAFSDSKEELTVGLNRENTNTGYLLGRLFAIMERAQIASVDPKSTIRDRYMATAAVSPRSVFYTLLRGYEHHISDLKKDDEKRWIPRMLEEEYNDVASKLPQEGGMFPKLLKQDEKEQFYIGFHLENQFLWKSKEERDAIMAEVNNKVTLNK